MATGLFIAATGQHSGKTTVSLGLIRAFTRRGLKVGYMKPVGQRTVEVDGVVVDEDVSLIDATYGAGASAAAAGPVTVPPGFTAEFLNGGDSKPLAEKIREGYAEVGRDQDIVIIEGTGHAGVGAVIELSNASVAQLLGSRAIIITGGGIGKPIDEFALNVALFERDNVPILGAVANKVIPDKLDKVRAYVEKGLAATGHRLFGAIPLRESLSETTVAQLVDELGAEVVSGEAHLDAHIRRYVVGAASAHRMMAHFGKGVLAIVPGDRDDLVLAALSSAVVGETGRYSVSALCLTGGVLPHENIMRIIRRAETPVIALDAGTFVAASKIDDVVAKIRPGETQKIRLANVLVEKYVDVDGLLDAMGVSVPAT
ncbi:MAG: AAA family ATPase [Armatimonadota bacterium]|jgi:hypothetical protein